VLLEFKDLGDLRVQRASRGGRDLKVNCHSMELQEYRGSRDPQDERDLRDRLDLLVLRV